MLCMDECEGRKIVKQRIGLLERAFQKCFGLKQGSRGGERASESCGVSRSGTAVLSGRELYVLDMSGDCKISCTQGAAWVTCPGRFCDYILKAGESLMLRAEGRIIISGGSENSRVEIFSGDLQSLGLEESAHKAVAME